MPTPAETPADRDARLEKAALERDKAVALLRRWRAAFWTRHDDDTPLATMSIATAEFLESLT